MVLWLCLAVWMDAMLLIAVPAIDAGLKSARRSRGRWGDRMRVHAPESDGPYREGNTTERIPRRAPFSVWVTAVAAPVWASVTLLVFCPMGTVLGCFGFCPNDGWESPSCPLPPALHGVLALACVAVLLSGGVLAVRLIRDSIALPRAGTAELRASRITAIYCAVHHAAVLAWWGLGTGMHDDFGAVPWIAAQCATGVLVALVQWRASSHLARALASEGAP